MSVLKSRRSVSKTEYLNTANSIYVQTLNFLSRLSNRYSRLIAEPIATLAGEVLDHTEKANNIFPSDELRKELRKTHLLEAKASLSALDVRLTHCYEIMILNPSGCFTTASSKNIDKSTSVKKLENMAQSLGELIDQEGELIKKVIESDRKRK